MKQNIPVWNISIKVKRMGKNKWVTNDEAQELLKDVNFARYYPEDFKTIPKGYIGLYFNEHGIVRKVIVKNLV
jgi:hypothetical protein